MSNVPSAPVQRPGVIVLSLQEALWPKLEKIGSNLSNGSTTGFKGHVTQTHEVKYNAAGRNSVSYVDTRSSIDFSQGPLKETSNDFDVAISGPGFLSFKNETDGVVYSRDGQLGINDKGVVVNILGDPLLSEGGSAITVPVNAKNISIAQDGTVAADGTQIDKIGLKDFSDKNTLNYIGQGYFKTDERGTAVLDPRLMQGFIEGSNRNAVNEVLNLVEIARYFENAQKLLDEDAKRQSKAINVSPTPA